MEISRSNSVHCVVGCRGTSNAIVDVAAGGSEFAGKIAGSDQFSARADRNGRASAVYTGVCGGDFRDGNDSPAGRAVLPGGFAFGIQLTGGDDGHATRCRNGNFNSDHVA